ncbi:hypothetical protein ACQPZP_10715 [Spirillospora sp. CA-142024]|uniref:hypothetical protein n=1 Tax=Spirillospora sp. CA-142024 TaxID=3240036 RepID=UPI003D8A631A
MAYGPTLRREIEGRSRCWASQYDGDPGGISGGVARQWKKTDAAANAAFNAKGEHFGLLNATSTSVSAKLYVEHQPNVFELNWELKLPKPSNGGASIAKKDRDLPEGFRVCVVVSIHKRGSCKSPILLG